MIQRPDSKCFGGTCCFSSGPKVQTSAKGAMRLMFMRPSFEGISMLLVA